MSPLENQTLNRNCKNAFLIYVCIVVLCGLCARISCLLHANKNLSDEGDLRIAADFLNALQVFGFSRDHKS